MKKITAIIFFLSVNLLVAQSTRSLINEGVDKYDESNFADAEVNFKKSLEKENDLFAGHYNLGSAYYKQERYDEALKQYQNSLALAESDYERAKIYHNIGNSLLKNQKLPESIEAYKQSLKLNPNDLETKYNLSYALKKQQEQKDQQKNQDNKDQNKDDQQNKDQQQNQDQNKDQEKNDQQNEDQKNDQQNQDQKKDEQEQQQNQQQQNQPKPNEISKEEAQRILEALKNNEADLQKELRKKKGKPVNKVKDW